MGSFYTGFDYKNRVNGYFKIGETSGKTPAKRLASIRKDDCFQCLGYILLKNETKAQRLFVESYVRMMMEKTFKGELEHTQNDHYLYKIISKEMKYIQAQRYADTALKFAMECCRLYGIEYTIGTKVYKRG